MAKDKTALEKALASGENIPTGEVFAPYADAGFDAKAHLAAQEAEDNAARKAAQEARQAAAAERRAATAGGQG